MQPGSLIGDVSQRMVEWRRHLHMHPELSFHEHETARYIETVLRDIPGVEVTRPTETSVMGILRGGAGDGPRLALRADIDALPIAEENDFAFASRNEGVMHACGHDGHTAMLLGAANALAPLMGVLRGEIRFVFQHAEELVPGGAREVIAAGVMENVDLVAGCHLSSRMPVGHVAVPRGLCMASADMFTVTVFGVGGHGAWPQFSIDPVAIGAQIVTNLQHVVARRTSPRASAVLSVTQFHGGSANNIIPDTVRLGGTVRAFDNEVREQTRSQLEQIATGIAAAHGARAELQYDYGYDAVVNDPEVAERVESCVRLIEGVEVVEIEPLSAGDDMTYFLQEAPGTYFFVGTRSEEADSTFPHHHPRFTIDERSLPVGAETFVRLALESLS